MNFGLKVSPDEEGAGRGEAGGAAGWRGGVRRRVERGGGGLGGRKPGGEAAAAGPAAMERRWRVEPSLRERCSGVNCRGRERAGRVEQCDAFLLISFGKRFGK